jgi:hypothetical protein
MSVQTVTDNGGSRAPTLLHALRAFVWLRWRLVANSIRGGQKRDRMEQVSRAFALFVPIILVVLSLGSVMAIAIAGFVGGRAVARGVIEPDVAVFILRLALTGALVLMVIVTIVSPHQTNTARYTRLLLLPIDRRMLHLVEVLASLADPSVAFVVPGLLTFVAGLAMYGNAGAAAWALAAAVGVALTFGALAALISFLVGWLLRSRRRSELFTLVFVLGVSLVSFLPAFFGERLENRNRGRTPRERRPPFSVDAFDRRLPQWTAAVPSELYGRAVRAGLEGRSAQAGLAVVLLFVQGGVAYVASGAVHRKLLTALEGERVRSRNATQRSSLGHLPLLNPQASAVALAQVRNGLRSVRGRLLVLLPGPMIAMMTLLFRQMGDDERFALTLSSNGHLMVGAGGIFCLYAMQALTMNMFGSDRAGLTLQFLTPIRDRDLALGKIAGCGIVFLVGLALAVVAAILVAVNTSPAFLLAVVMGVIATYILLSPLFVWFSALFPVASDLSKTGSGGNPHPLPMFAGTILVLLFAAPAALIIAFTQFWLQSAALAPMLMAGWLLIASAIGVPLVGVASRTIAARRENLAMVAQGK